MEFFAVFRVYRAYAKEEKNQQRADKEFAEMCAAVEHLRSVGVKSICFSVLTDGHPEADKWATAEALRKEFSRYRGVRVIETSGDPFYGALEQALDPLRRLGATHILSVSHTSVHLLTPKVMGWVRRSFREGAVCTAIVPPDMQTGLRGAANNQCMAWDIRRLFVWGGFDKRDIKPHNFNMEKSIQGVGEIMTALNFGAHTMAVILPDVEQGDTRDTPDQAKKRAHKVRRIEAWLERDGRTWEDLEALIMPGYPVDLRSK